MNVKIIAPDSRKLMTVEWIDAHTLEGSLVIMPGHAPVLLQLTENKTIAFGLMGGAVKSMVITGGLLRVERDGVIIILDA